jgi:hypothetical protein
MDEDLDELVGDGVPDSPPVRSALSGAEREVDMPRGQAGAEGPLGAVAVRRERDAVFERVAVDDGPGRDRGWIRTVTVMIAGKAGHNVRKEEGGDKIVRAQRRQKHGIC